MFQYIMKFKMCKIWKDDPLIIFTSTRNTFLKAELIKYLY